MPSAKLPTYRKLPYHLSIPNIQGNGNGGSNIHVVIQLIANLICNYYTADTEEF